MGVANDPIKIEGLALFSRELRAIDSDLPKGLRVVQNSAADIVVKHARAETEVSSGRAQRSIKASSTRTLARVKGGGPRTPYYPWLDFGGRVGRKRSVARRFIKSGRYIYPGYAENKSKIKAKLNIELVKTFERFGWTVKGG